MTLTIPTDVLTAPDAAPTSAPAKKRYAVVGTGGRVSMFIDPLVRDYAADGELVGLCDTSQTRMTYHQNRLAEEYGYARVPTYLAADFERMVRETKPDVVIVVTVDATHHTYINWALALGCDVITEKPLTTDAQKCRSILDAVEESNRNVRVTFNFRWAPGPTKVRELLKSGTIGRVHAVNLEYQLNTEHGADYFRRWHSEKASSGGLLVHKSTHHFDLVNWWIDAVPSEVFAWGGLNFYGRENALARGEDTRTAYERYTGVEASKDDPFALDLNSAPQSRELYLNAEAETGYIRDRNVFREGIDIEDTMSVLVRYRTGAVLNYSLVAYSPQEGFRVTFSGDKGRLEYTEKHASHIILGQSDQELGQQQAGLQMHLRVIPHFQEGYDVPLVAAAGGHGGGDPLIQRQIFSLTAPVEQWNRNAGDQQGAASALVGIAANASIQSGLPVAIDELCPLAPGKTHLSELR